jgi:hypothetical protein
MNPLRDLRIGLLAFLIGQSPIASAVPNADVPDIHMYFAAKLSTTMTVLQSKELAWSNVRQFELLCVRGECFLEVLSVATEYCDGTSRPSGPETSGVNHDLVSNFLPGTDPLHVEQIDKDTLLVRFRDFMLWGPTEESLIVTYADKYPRPVGMQPNSTKVATNISGSATGLQASAQKPRAATYESLAAPVFCTVAFWPTGR